ncbi:MAG: Xanthine phosphoribosyltransferase [Candidatus Beckwithbacteria bacterium GW2011_GWB1_47_15]|uniref:Xanthine phosphoribosyltransferase n=1 Tax=Candidatus Beckwithbacteria bacterium GW2011_GWB1_47_15 TaxID=1618371 RepID=A0A0G1RWF3_9BACT|nr:MAG: xanthine phosphoribosyltransferase [Candidatus Beckwithbacteria bacterium GW2011_GWC1_49_16]KKU35361.1 MAG: Xanthine phosphoribosyltransferase [Candidatus Beckwithbacteria bacterium GW2011_GWA1_46_30]KKU61456.1 MAG: Xanthine phosphoribosyltransferase [Candidatus Beckwithbacteria bacterium GW2011_GWB1_47_15]KKU71863.1 MAG: Xanthine phosphoribosyltransferase [Candidatus Beckwithbacteria bacterium GW2011_GWA2_47_25]KKW03758.1 MAG: Xanthine phosphoribosyltransferase [Candidatus Beckwithbact
MRTELLADLKFLRSEFLRDAKVIDADKGYISVSAFNLRMKPKILAVAARVIAAEFRKDEISAIHGIPHSGNFLATATAIELNRDVRLHASRKDQNIPASWKDVYREEIRSFTTSSAGIDVFSGINLSFVKKGDKVLLLDDVCATGETGYRIVAGLKKRGVNVVGFAVLWDKVFQGGVDTVAKLGIKVFSCVRVKKLGRGDQVELLE